MRLLHTSDWHVGKAIRGRSRAQEHQAVLAEVAGIAERDAVDLVIVAGDVFDTSTPTAESERIVYRALLDLAAGGRPVIVVAGNHDSAPRLQAVAPLSEASGIRVASPICCCRATPPTPTPPTPIAWCASSARSPTGSGPTRSTSSSPT